MHLTNEYKIYILSLIVLLLIIYSLCYWSCLYSTNNNNNNINKKFNITDFWLSNELEKLNNTHKLIFEFWSNINHTDSWLLQELEQNNKIISMLNRCI